jgi:hypothetical protein
MNQLYELYCSLSAHLGGLIINEEGHNARPSTFFSVLCFNSMNIYLFLKCFYFKIYF